VTDPLRTIAAHLRITRPLVVVDVETTGTAFGVDRIIQIGILKAYPADEAGVIKTTFWSTFIDPQMSIPAEATLAHKITNAMIAGAPTWSDVARTICAGLVNVDFIGQNVKFDLRFLEAEFKRVGVLWGYADALIIDTLRIDQVKDPRDLAALLRKYCGEEHFEALAHDALNDVNGTARVLAAQLEAYRDLPQSVAALHALLFPRDPSWIDAVGKIVWRNAEACVGFGEHNGKPLKTCDKGFLRWMLRKDFADDVKQIVRDALDGKFPIRAAVESQS
jgi:DNA polymerase III subunit epsilon